MGCFAAVIFSGFDRSGVYSLNLTSATLNRYSVMIKAIIRGAWQSLYESLKHIRIVLKYSHPDAPVSMASHCVYC